MITFRALAAAAALLAAVPAQADTCQLKQIASLDIVRGADGSVLVPVTIKGQPEYLILQMDSAHSGLTKSTVAALGLTETVLPTRYHVNYFQQRALSTALATGFTIGGVKGDIDAFVIPDLADYDPRAAGVLGVEVLKSFDVELNLRAAKLNLFSQDHCAGQVIYWSHAPYAALPMQTQKLGNFVVPMEMDGQKITVTIDTLHAESLMEIDDAGTLFGVTVTTPGVGPAVAQKQQHPVQRKYVFKTLSGDGVTVSNPEVELFGEPSPDGQLCDSRTHPPSRARCYGTEADLEIGLNIESQLRLYFAFGEKMLYFTAADDAPNRK